MLSLNGSLTIQGETSANEPQCCSPNTTRSFSMKKISVIKKRIFFPDLKWKLNVDTVRKIYKNNSFQKNICISVRYCSLRIALFHQLNSWLFLGKSNIPMSSSVSKSYPIPNQRALRTNMLAGLLRHCITGRLGLRRPLFAQSSGRNTVIPEALALVRIVSQNIPAETRCEP